MNKVSEITKCRIEGGNHLLTVLDLGVQTLTGVFPRSPAEPITQGPLQLAWCPQSGLLQLRHSYDLSEMYGMNYGYRSGLNASMVRHLTRKIHLLSARYEVAPGDAVIDIGSNDATTLKAYPVSNLKRIGVDPTGVKFAAYYDQGIELIPDFFSASALGARFPGLQANIITSFAMFSDLEPPLAFRPGNRAPKADALKKSGISSMP
jgi:hypothetical protein